MSHDGQLRRAGGWRRDFEVGTAEARRLHPAVGKALAQSILGQSPVVPLEPYRLGRFAEDDLMRGAYGIGSIS